MRWGIAVSLVFVLAGLFMPAACSADPSWALISTEVLEGTGKYTDQDVLQLFYDPDPLKNFAYWKTPAEHLFFNPSAEIGLDYAGLDAFHLINEMYYFSTEVDVMYGGVLYTDQDLLTWNGVTLGKESTFDTINGLLGDDYGLDAVCFTDGTWVFSTEVGGEFETERGMMGFTDGDVLVFNDEGKLDVFPLFDYFGRNVGLDALHAYHEGGESENDEEYVQIIMSTEVDGQVYDPKNRTYLDFNNEDILTLSLHRDGESWVLDSAEVPWLGVPKMGRDVGLDALYIGPEIPEPATMLLVSVGLGALALRLRRKR